MTYVHKSVSSMLLKKLRMSRAMKIKSGWSRESGAGFIKEDIKGLAFVEDKILFNFSWGNQEIEIKELNLRETEESINWLELEA